MYWTLVLCVQGPQNAGRESAVQTPSARWLLRAEMFQGVAHWRWGDFGTAFAIVSDESPISAGATFYIVDASNGLMKALTTFAFGRAAVEIN